MPRVKRVSPCGVCMMGRLFVVSGFMMLSCFALVTRGMRMMLSRLLVVIGCFLGMWLFPLFGGPQWSTPRELAERHPTEIVPI
jgi:hypothetical protein